MFAVIEVVGEVEVGEPLGLGVALLDDVETRLVVALEVLRLEVCVFITDDEVDGVPGRSEHISS